MTADLDDVLPRLAAAVEAGDRDGVVRESAGLTEPERLVLGPRLAPLIARVRAEHWEQVWAPGGASAAMMERITAAAAADAATAPASRAGESLASGVEGLDLLAHRSASWRGAWADQLTAWRNVGLVYRATREGLVERPTGRDWLLGLLGGLPVGTTLADAIAADPVLQERELWELFETEGGGRDSLANADKYSTPDRTWAEALRTLAGRGVLDRDRLLDASLASLSQDLPQYQAGWFSAFHTSLDPTVEEHRARYDVYARLLRSPIPPTVSFAVRALRRAGPVDERVLQAHLSPALLARTKTTALGALALLEGCAQPDPALAAVAAEHPAADVQARAVRLLARLGATVDRSALAPRLRAAAPDTADTADTEVPDLPARRVVDPQAPRQLRPLEPVRDAADLAQRLAALAERLDDPDEMDLVVAGAARLGPSPEVQAALAPLARAARRRLVDVHQESPATAVVAALVVALAEPGAPLPDDLRTLPWADQLDDVRAGRAPLQTPTHVGGWLDVDELAHRLRADPHPLAADVSAALERVPPWQAHRLVELALPQDDLVAATWERLLSPTPPSYAVGPGRRDLYGRDTLQATGPDVRFVDRWPHEDVAVRRDAHARPGRKEAHYASGVAALATNRDWREACWNERLFLEPLLDPEEPLGTMAALLVATALATKEPGQRRAAVDVVVQAVDDGRLDVETLSDGLTRAVDWSAPARLAGTLADAASAGPLQALVVRRAMLRALPAYDRGVRGLSALLETVLDLNAGAGEAVAGDVRGWLEAMTGSSKAARAAQALLAVQGRGTAQQRAAVEQALARRAEMGLR